MKLMKVFFLCLLSLTVFAVCSFAETPGIKIVQPQDGAIVHPGDEITVTVEAVGGFILKDGLLGASYFFQEEVLSLPVSFTITIPNEVVGNIPIDVFGKDSSDEFVGDEITLTIEQTAILQSLIVDPEDYEFETDWNGEIDSYGMDISVKGVYSDEITRKITTVGTTYVSSDSSVVTVNSQGLMKPLRLGEAVITVSNSGVETTIPVKVRKPRGIPPEETIAPVTHIDIQPPADEAGRHNSDVTITLVATDNEGGSGVKEIDYHLVGMTPGIRFIDYDTVEGYVVQIILSNEGASKLNYSAKDNEGNYEKRHFVDFYLDKTPPQLTLTVTPVTLWPSNHRMVEIMPSVTATDNLDENPQIKLESVISNEPDDAPGVGDGNTIGDVEITEDGKILLRAERSGKGDGRIYTITYSATDLTGNKSTALVTVTVPHDQEKKSEKGKK